MPYFHSSETPTFSQNNVEEMDHACHLSQINLSDSTKLESLVEHRRVYNLKHCELNIFETFHRCSDVTLSYNGLVVSSMMRGRKVISLAGDKEFDFLPGESVILPDDVSMRVDFPEADINHPVQCATLTLDWDVVDKNLEFLNEHYPNSEVPYQWQLNFSKYHFVNNKELAGSINKLISISMETDTAKDALADLSLKFLLLRIIQTQNLASLQETSSNAGRFAGVIDYINRNLAEKISVDTLARECCMSRSAFFLSFKNQFSITPLEYILRERIRHAKMLLQNSQQNITEICYQSGFNNLNYFIRQFKKQEGIPPSLFRN
jgi:AraC family transcriptional regulator of arabinose operon